MPSETAKVADLGLAQESGGASVRSIGGSLALPHPGTPAYMSPEQETTVSYLRPASDIYTLGLVIFEMLTGRNYKNLTPDMHVMSLRVDTPVWLDDLLARMLADDWRTRPLNVTELLRRGISDDEKEQEQQKQREVEEQARKEAQERERRVAEQQAKAEAQHQAQVEAERKAREERERLAAEEALARAEAEREAHKHSNETSRWMTRRTFLLGVGGVATVGGLAWLLSNRLPVLAPVSTEMPTPADTAAPSPTTISDTHVAILTLAQGVTLELVRVPAGEFLMGSVDSDKDANNDEKPQSTLNLEEYWIGKYEVTNAQFRVFVQATDYKTTAEQLGSAGVYDGSQWKDMPGASWQFPRGQSSDVDGKGNYPVVQMSWDDAVAFCVWASQVTGRKVQLPSEAQWEKAARGIDGRLYPWGNEAPDSIRLNYNRNVGDTTPVGKYSQQGDSPYGVSDMSGNVWEWTSSLYKPYPYNADDGREDQQSRDTRVVRGGSWVSDQDGGRASYRSRDDPGDRGYTVGFRVVSGSAPSG